MPALGPPPTLDQRLTWVAETAYALTGCRGPDDLVALELAHKVMELLFLPGFDAALAGGAAPATSAGER